MMHICPRWRRAYHNRGSASFPYSAEEGNAQKVENRGNPPSPSGRGQGEGHSICCHLDPHPPHFYLASPYRARASRHVGLSQRERLFAPSTNLLCKAAE